MKKSTFKHWWLAARPRTLSASVMPVVLACVLAWQDGRFRWIPAAVCFLFAVIAQVVSNFFNDYSDFVKGSDRADRLGPQRAVAGGWIKASDMLRVSIVLMACGCMSGLILVYYAGWQLIFAGFAVCVGAFAYSAGPYPLAYKGWGDVCVVLFYGIIPVGFTYYVQTLAWTPPVTICGLAMGLVTTNILVANNYRDREQDAISGKRTTVVIFGEKFGRYFYLFNGILAVCFCVCFFFIFQNRYWAAFLPMLYLLPHVITWRKMALIRQGEALNQILAESARNVVIFGILLSIGNLL
jgi:1,4-dihydroxy-2-naphthoate octaprenyltransferase